MVVLKRVSKSNISKSLKPCRCVNSDNDEEENVIQELDGCVEDLDSLVGKCAYAFNQPRLFISNTLAILGVVTILTYRDYFSLCLGLFALLIVYFPIIIYDEIILWWKKR